MVCEDNDEENPSVIVSLALWCRDYLVMRNDLSDLLGSRFNFA